MKLEITESAWNRIDYILNKNRDNIAVRLSLVDGGCQGIKYKLSLTKKIDDEIVFSNNQNKFIIDQSITEYLHNATIDFNTKKLVRSSFIITNPNANKSCGCGASFRVK